MACERLRKGKRYLIDSLSFDSFPNLVQFPLEFIYFGNVPTDDSFEELIIRSDFRIQFVVTRLE